MGGSPSKSASRKMCNDEDFQANQVHYFKKDRHECANEVLNAFLAEKRPLSVLYVSPKCTSKTCTVWMRLFQLVSKGVFAVSKESRMLIIEVDSAKEIPPDLKCNSGKQLPFLFTRFGPNRAICVSLDVWSQKFGLPVESLQKYTEQGRRLLDLLKYACDACSVGFIRDVGSSLSDRFKYTCTVCQLKDKFKDLISGSKK